jgi:hypothetical protein
MHSPFSRRGLGVLAPPPALAVLPQARVSIELDRPGLAAEQGQLRSR